MLNSATASPLPGPPHFVDLHVNPGESVSIQFFDGNETILRGPTTIKMISNHAYPPMPLPVQVPPGHMIQQIVDENGTLRHIILSALSGNGNNCYSNSNTFGPSHQSHQTQSGQNGTFCCCCLQTCTTPVTNGQASPLSSALPAAAATATVAMQSQLAAHSSVFPLSSGNSYARNRRTNRTFSSPNSKRPPSSSFISNGPTGYFGTSPLGAKAATAAAALNHNGSATISNSSSSSRYSKADNPKSNQYSSSRPSSHLHFEASRPFEAGSESSKYYLNKSYDYSCNSSNASQASTIDQVNDNLKYYKEEEDEVEATFCVENSFTRKKKSFEMDKTRNATKESIAFYLNHQPNAVSDQEDSPQRSSQSECTELSMNNSQSSANFELSFGTSDPVGRTDLANEHCAQPRDDRLGSHKTTLARADPTTTNFTKPKEEKEVTGTDIDSSGEVNSPKKKNNRRAKVVFTPKETSSSRGSLSPSEVMPSQRAKREPMANTAAVVQLEQQRAVEETAAADGGEDVQCDALHRDKQAKPLANGNLEPYSGQSDVCDYVITPECEDDDSEKTDSEPYAEDEGEQEDRYRVATVTQQQRSPRHLLPKVQVIALSCSSLSSHSVRLKWSFASLSGEYSEHKKHFIVDMLRGNVEDSPSTRIVYQGHSVTCRVSHLSPQKEYTFRVRTNTDTAVLTSNTLTVVTEQLSSNGLRGRKTKQQQASQQQQQQQQLHSALVTAQNQQLHQAAEESQAAMRPSPSEMLMQARLSRDQHCAIFLLGAFTCAALIIAVLIQYWLGAAN